MNCVATKTAPLVREWTPLSEPVTLVLPATFFGGNWLLKVLAIPDGSSTGVLQQRSCCWSQPDSHVSSFLASWIFFLKGLPCIYIGLGCYPHKHAHQELQAIPAEASISKHWGSLLGHFSCSWPTHYSPSMKQLFRSGPQVSIRVSSWISFSHWLRFPTKPSSCTAPSRLGQSSSRWNENQCKSLTTTQNKFLLRFGEKNASVWVSFSVRLFGLGEGWKQETPVCCSYASVLARSHQLPGRPCPHQLPVLCKFHHAPCPFLPL